MSDDPLRVGVLGYRFMGEAHSNALARLPMFFPDAPAVERHTLVGRDEEALAAAADRLGFARTATDWEAAIDDVDVFYNLGPNHLHAEPSIAALESDTPVLCEKPLARTLDEAEGMRDAAADTDAVAACAFNYRFVPAIRYAKRLIDDGELGDIRQVRGRYLQDWLADPDEPWSWRNDEELAGSGALGDLGAHTVDLARFLVGDRAGEVTRVSGQLRTFTDERPLDDDDGTRAVTVDDAYSAQVAYENGATGTFEASRVTEGHKNDHSIAVHGTDGSVTFSLERLNELEVLTGDDRGYETVLVTDQDDPYVDHWWPPGHVLGWEHTFVHENYEFLSAVAEGREFSPSFADAYEVQRVLDAVERSDERGEWVTLDR
ncbi:Gfo/Idh/MocA family protein [Candidatus Halobonum tyrrellensis]|uniref:Gfo/Idh/MocA family protein n=1 Tax=Candidatus Halobonum tyrrellensis TaxID=1431545 RepID=UPI0009B5B133|nr:Gfo/Idh/MocA family oxidoreductase [Candidatus Halobonum tyrrellensis]